jgi:hypothetical protein
MFNLAKDLSNIRGVSITDTGSGAIVGVLLSGAPAVDSNLESLALRVHIEYREQQQKDIDVLMQDALQQAMKAIQHEITLCLAKAKGAACNDAVNY